MKRLIFMVWFIALTVFSPPQTYGSNKVSVPQELKKLKFNDELMMQRLDDLECQLSTIQNNYDALKLSIDAASREAKNSKEYIDNNLMWTRIIFGAIAFLGIASLILLFRYLGRRINDEVNKIPKGFEQLRETMNTEFNSISQTMETTSRQISAEIEQIPKKVEDEVKKIAEKYDTQFIDIHKVTTRFHDSMARLHHRVAYEEYEKWTKASEEEKEIILRRIIETQRKAQESAEDAYGKEVEKLGDREKYVLLEIWQNMAYYLALAQDRTESAWAIEAVKIALEWGSGRKPFTPPKGATFPIMHFIETYFYVLSTFDLPEFREEWAKNYRVWKDDLYKEYPKKPFLAVYDSYLKKIEGTGGEENRSTKND